MNRFQRLLDPRSNCLPGKQQLEASQRLPAVVSGSGLHWWGLPATRQPEGNMLLVIVAPYSQYDLAMLDLLDHAVREQLARPSASAEHVYVSNIQCYSSLDELRSVIPPIRSAPPQTPIVARWEKGLMSQWAVGKAGRDLAAEVLGIPAERFNREILSRIPGTPRDLANH